VRPSKGKCYSIFQVLLAFFKFAPEGSEIPHPNNVGDCTRLSGAIELQANLNYPEGETEMGIEVER
jgi:hypothetical protein